MAQKNRRWLYHNKNDIMKLNLQPQCTPSYLPLNEVDQTCVRSSLLRLGYTRNDGIFYQWEDGPGYCKYSQYICYPNQISNSFYLISLNYLSVTDVKIITGDQKIFTFEHNELWQWVIMRRPSVYWKCVHVQQHCSQ